MNAIRAGKNMSPPRKCGRLSRLCQSDPLPKRFSAIVGLANGLQRRQEPARNGSGPGFISGVSLATYARAPSHWNISACSARWSSRKFRAERHTASSRFGAHYGELAPPWDIAGRMKIHRRAYGIYSLSRANCSGPTRRLFCSSRPHGEPGIADLPPPLPLRGIFVIAG